MSIVVNIPSGVLKKWERGCKEAWPQEYYGILLGAETRKNGNRHVGVAEIFVPPNWRVETTHTYTHIPNEWPISAQKVAREHCLFLIGEIHSHPYQWEEKELSPSAMDFDCFPWAKVTIITNVCQRIRWRGGRYEAYLQTKTAAFPPLIKTTLEVL